MTPNRASGCVTHTKKYFLLKKCLHCLYTKVRQNYFTIEQLSALVYTPRWVEGEMMVLLIKALKKQKLEKTKKGVAICKYFSHTANKKNFHHFYYQKAYFQK